MPAMPWGLTRFYPTNRPMGGVGGAPSACTDRPVFRRNVFFPTNRGADAWWVAGHKCRASSSVVSCCPRRRWAAVIGRSTTNITAIPSNASSTIVDTVHPWQSNPAALGCRFGAGGESGCPSPPKWLYRRLRTASDGTMLRTSSLYRDVRKGCGRRAWPGRGFPYFSMINSIRAFSGASTACGALAGMRTIVPGFA